MTCASCANRVERRLNELDGVQATVNYATEQAAVEFDPAAVAPQELVAAVEEAGYTAVLPEHDEDDAVTPEDPTASLRRRLIVSARAVRARAPAVDDPGAPVRQLAVARAPARHAGRAVGRVAVPPRRLGEPAPRGRDDGHAGQRRRARRLAVVAVRTVPRRGGRPGHADAVRHLAGARRRRGSHLPRGRRRRDDVHPRGPLLRGARQAPCRCGADRAARARRQGRRGARRRRRGAARADRGPARRRPLRRAPGREGRDRRHRRGRPLRPGHGAAHRRAGAGRGRPGLGRRRRDGQRRRAARRARDEGRRGHGARADRAPGHRGAVGQGPRPAPRRPHLRRLRPGRHRPRGRDARVLDGVGRGRDLRVHRGSGRPDHRLPVRARARHADGAARRHRPRRPARPAHQGAGDPRVDAPGRHRGARQDGDGHHRADDAHRGAPRRGHRRAPSCCASPARSSTRPSTRSPRRSPARRARSSAACRASTASRTARGSASRASSTVTR